MGRLTIAMTMFLCATTATAERYQPTMPQQHKDAIREYHTKQIMGSSQDLTVLQPDVVLARKLLASPARPVDTRQLPEPDAVPFAQIFKASDLNLGQIVGVAAAASGYDVSWHGQVDQGQRVLINTKPNSLTDIAEYLTRVTTARFTVYPESRVMVVLPKDAINE